MELKKVQKQGRDERTQEDYPTSAKIHTRCRVVFLRSFISAFFLYFFRVHPYLKSSFIETFSLVSVLFSRGSKNRPFLAGYLCSLESLDGKKRYKGKLALIDGLDQY